MNKLGIIANCRKERAGHVLKILSDSARELGLDLCAFGEAADLLPNVNRAPSVDALSDVDAIVALGGDGTMLKAVRELFGLNKPLIGVNIGSLGFMTSVAEHDLVPALSCLRDESFTVSERSLAECVVTHGDKTDIYCALNDVVVTTGASPRVITLDVSIDGVMVTSYVCDGLIISTPTGSTGHSLSAGGPIVYPETPAFVVSPICPHTLSSRPLVVPDNSEIRICVRGESADARLSVDGQVGLAMCTDDRVVVGRCEQKVRFLHLPDYDYYRVLRQKLRWQGSAV